MDCSVKFWFLRIAFKDLHSALPYPPSFQHHCQLDASTSPSTTPMQQPTCISLNFFSKSYFLGSVCDDTSTLQFTIFPWGSEKGRETRHSLTLITKVDMGVKHHLNLNAKFKWNFKEMISLVLTTVSATTISSSNGPEVCGPSLLHSGVLHWQFLRSTALGGKFSNPFWVTIPAYY